MPHAVESKSKHSSAQHKSEHKEAKGGVPNANTSKCKQNPVRLRVQPTAMERAEALPLLGFRRRAPHACPASAAVQRVCRERASKRWSALLTQTKSRIGHRCGMRKRLGEAHWAAFVRYAETEHKAQFFRVLAPASGELLAQLLFGTEDHVLAQCSTRRVWRRQILLRCGNTRGSIEPQHADEFCHDVAGAHYEHALQVEDLRWPVISDAKPC